MSEQFLYFLQQMFNGVTLGSTYALIAIGYTMVYGIIGMINFAHGEVYMIGSYVSFMIIAALMMMGIDTGWLLVVSRELMRDFNEYSMLMLGGLMVLMMIWRPQGLLPMTRPQLKLKNGAAKGEQA